MDGTPRLHETPPAGGEAVWLRAADEVTLRAAFWDARGAARGTVLLMTGRSEFIEKYYPAIEGFLSLGLRVAAFDWRGQGLSDRLIENRLPGYIDDFESYQRDLDTLLAEIGRRGWGARVVLVGHSMGGCAILRRMARAERDFHAAILTAPMLGLRFPTLAAPALRALSWSLSHWRVGKWRVSPRSPRTAADWPFEGNVLTNNRAEFERYAALVRDHPRLALGGVTWGWLAAAFREMRFLRRLPPGTVDVPTLLFSAGDERLVSNDAIDAFAAREPRVEHIRLADCRHEPFVELPPVQAVLWREIGGFLDRVLV